MWLLVASYRNSLRDEKYKDNIMNIIHSTSPKKGIIGNVFTEIGTFEITEAK